MKLRQLFAFLALVGLTSMASANGFLIEIDTDGADDGTVTLNPNFAYGEVFLPQPNDAMGNPVPPALGVMTASQSSPAGAVGLSGADSIFGGTAASGTDFPNPDTYIYTYTPAVDADNFGVSTGTPLNEFGDLSTGLSSGAAGTHRVYAAWPDSGNISFNGLPTNYVLNDGTTDVLTAAVSQDNDSGGFTGNQWIPLGDFELDPSKTYTLTQTSGQDFVPGAPGFSPDVYTNGFVSMRAAAVLFQAVPEPTSALLVLAGVAGLGFARRR